MDPASADRVRLTTMNVQLSNELADANALRTLIGKSLVVSCCCILSAVLLDVPVWLNSTLGRDLTPEAFAQLAGVVLFWAPVFAVTSLALCGWCRAGTVFLRKWSMRGSVSFHTALSLLPLTVAIVLIMTTSQGLRFTLTNVGSLTILLPLFAFLVGVSLFMGTWAVVRVAVMVSRGANSWRIGAALVLSAAVAGCNYVDKHWFVGFYEYPHFGLLVVQLLGLHLVWWIIFQRRRLSRLLDWRGPLALLVLAVALSAALTVSSQRSDTLERLPIVYGSTLMAKLYRVERAIFGIQLERPERRERVVDAPERAQEPASRQCRHAVIVTLDAVRRDHTGVGGYARRTTPTLDQLASEGVVFEHAIASSPTTYYTVPAILLGADAPAHRRLIEAPSISSLPELLRSHGFATYCELDLHMLKRYGTSAEHLGCSVAMNYDRELASTERFAVFLSQHNPQLDRIFAYLHVPDAHSPYGRESAVDFGNTTVDKYDSGVWAADYRLSVFLDALRDNGYDDACIVVTADHGEALGEHGGYQWHASSLFHEQIDVPLVIKVPGVPPGRSSSAVDSTSIAPTLLVALGVAPASHMRRSLFSRGDSRAEPRAAYSYCPSLGLSALTDGRLKLIEDSRNAVVLLFDLVTDPTELHPINRAHELLAEYRERLWLHTQAIGTQPD